VKCGDGVVDGDELCDDGNEINGDGCTGCRLDDGWTCLHPGRPCSGE
jgi:cysteine-rich repeat protein